MNLGENLTTIILAFARISSFLFMIPFLSSQVIPRMAKVVIAVGISLAVAGQTEVELINNSAQFIGVLLMQVIIGITLAKIVEVLMSIPLVAGAIMDMEMGFSMANIFDPATKQNATILATMMNIMFIVIFIYLDGIQQLVATIVRSFDLTATLLYFGEEKFLEFITMTFAYMLTSAIQIALPIMGAMFIVNFVLLVIGKTAPQTQIFVNMFPVKITAGILFLAVTLPILGDVFSYLSGKILEEYMEAFNYMFKR